MDNTTCRHRLASLALVIALLLPPVYSWAAFSLDDPGDPSLEEEPPAPAPEPDPYVIHRLECGSINIELNTGVRWDECLTEPRTDGGFTVYCGSGKNRASAYCNADGTGNCLKTSGKGKCDVS